MNQVDITNSLYNYIKHNRTYFYIEAINYVKKLPNTVYEIDDNPYSLEASRVHINQNSNKYVIYFTYTIPKKYTYRKLTLNNKQIGNLNFQLNYFKNPSISIYELCKKHINNQLEEILPSGQNTIYVVFAKVEDKINFNIISKFKYNTDLVNILLGIESLNLLKYQNIDRFCQFFIDPKLKKISNLIEGYINKHNQFQWYDRDHIMIFSGMISQILGFTYTQDIDLLIVNDLANFSYINDVMKILYSVSKSSYDAHFLLRDKKWIKIYGKYDKLTKKKQRKSKKTKKKSTNLGKSDIGNYKFKKLDYQNQWLTYTLPQLAGAQDIYEVISNPKFHTHFLNIKLISVDFYLQRRLTRFSTGDIVDLLMINKLNNVKIPRKICFPNMNVRAGQIYLYDDKLIEKYYKDIKKFMKLWHNNHISVEDLKKNIKRCDEEMSSIYTGKVMFDKDTSALKHFHTMIKPKYLKDNCYNCNYMLDIGSGRLRDLKFWLKSNIKNIIAIEPSLYSYNESLNTLDKLDTNKINIDVINGYGDIDWWKSDLYKPIQDAISKGHKMDCVTFMFTIHYMVKNMKILMENLEKVCKKGTKIIILCLDGKYVHEQLLKKKGNTKNSNRIEVRNSQEPIFGIYSYYKLEEKLPQLGKILVYLKGTHGVQLGSIEYLVTDEYLTRKFSSYGYLLKHKINLVDIHIKERQKMNYLQKQVSRFYMGMLFEKI